MSGSLDPKQVNIDPLHSSLAPLRASLAAVAGNRANNAQQPQQPFANVDNIYRQLYTAPIANSYVQSNPQQPGSMFQNALMGLLGTMLFRPNPNPGTPGGYTPPSGGSTTPPSSGGGTGTTTTPSPVTPPPVTPPPVTPPPSGGGSTLPPGYVPPGSGDPVEQPETPGPTTTDDKYWWLPGPDPNDTSVAAPYKQMRYNNMKAWLDVNGSEYDQYFYGRNGFTITGDPTNPGGLDRFLMDSYSRNDGDSAKIMADVRAAMTRYTTMPAYFDYTGKPSATKGTSTYSYNPAQVQNYVNRVVAGKGVMPGYTSATPTTVFRDPSGEVVANPPEMEGQPNGWTANPVPAPVAMPQMQTTQPTFQPQASVSPLTQVVQALVQGAPSVVSGSRVMNSTGGGDVSPEGIQRFKIPELI